MRTFRRRMKLNLYHWRGDKLLNRIPGKLVEYNKLFLDKGQNYGKGTIFSVGFHVLKAMNCGEQMQLSFPYDGNRLSNNYQLSV